MTLCLAPLLGHILAGVPSPTYLRLDRPNWHQRIVMFNPTTIVWRYFAITDRRLRAKNWTPLNMAASNAVFWTTEGWDGSEAMIQKSINYCLRPPRQKHIDLFSATNAKTIIVTLQGVQAIYSIVVGVRNSTPQSNAYANALALDYVFVPLAIVGLFRLVPALWLADDYSFANIEVANNSNVETEPVQNNSIALGDKSKVDAPLTLSLRSGVTGMADEDCFHPSKGWRGISVRVFFYLPLLCLLGIIIYFSTPQTGTAWSATGLLVNLFYLILLGVGVVIFARYMFPLTSPPTIIPCASSIWYKIYTCFLLALVVTIIIIACIETRKTSCGTYTTFPKSFDSLVCPATGGTGPPVDREISTPS